MSITFMATADQRDTKMFNKVEGIEVSSAKAHTGSYSYRTTSLGYLEKWISNSSNSPFVRVAVLSTNTTTRAQIYFADGNDIHTMLDMNFETGMVDVLRGWTSISGGAYNANLQPDRWYIAEVQTVIGQSGSCVVMLNERPIFNLTNVNTDSGSGQISRIRIVGYGMNFYFDDIVFDDAEFPGDGGIHVLVPTGPGGIATWTASAGEPYQCVDELPVTFDDYIYRENPNPGAHSFAHQPLDYMDDIIGIGIVVDAKMERAGTGRIRPLYVDPETNQMSFAQASTYLDVSAIRTAYYRSTNFGAPWNRNTVNRIHIGVMTFSY